MKKIILSIVFVFASFAVANANTSAENDNFNGYLELDFQYSILLSDDCFDFTWEIGSEWGGGDAYLEGITLIWLIIFVRPPKK